MPSCCPGLSANLNLNADGRLPALTLLLVIIAMSGIIQVRSVAATSLLLPHLPIVINGNSDFIPQNGVTSGKGTARDPYVIEGWSIASVTGQPGIEIEQTTAFFVVRNVETLSASIYILNANHGSVVNSTLNGGDQVVRIVGSQDVTISRNIIMNGQITVGDVNQGPFSTNLVIANNTLVNTSIFISSNQNPTTMRVSNNTILGYRYAGYGIFVSAVGATISDNVVSGTGTGIDVGGSQNTVKDNILHTTGYSIQLSDAIATTLSGNVMTGLGIAIRSPAPPYDYPSYYDSQSIAANNLVNGSPVLYYSRCAGLNLSNVSVGQLIIASCSMVQVSNITTIARAAVGVLLAYVQQARLIDDHLNGNCNGLMVTESSYVNVSESEISSNNCQAITIARSPNFRLAHNVISGNWEGVFDDGSTDFTIEGNLVSSNSHAGGQLGGEANLIVSQNHIQNNGGDGLILGNVVSALIQGNWVSRNQGAGLSISSANGVNITANTMIYNDVGIRIGTDPYSGFVYNAIVYHNNFVYNIHHQADHTAIVSPPWDNGYPSGGNYWSDYAGVDHCSGLHQDVCTQPDGIGDTPYTGIIEITTSYPRSQKSPLVDHYPLVKPFGNITQDTKPPTWPSGSTLNSTKLNSTSVSLLWSRADDDTWVNTYQISKNGTVIALVPGNSLSYTVSGLSPGSNYLFKIEAGDPAGERSTDGPSSTITLPRLGQSTTPSPNTSPFSFAWWSQNPIWAFVIAATVGIIGGLVGLARRRILTARTHQTQMVQAVAKKQSLGNRDA